MQHDDHSGGTNRRKFLQALAVLGVGGQAFLRSGDSRAAVYAARAAVGRKAPWPELGRRSLGRTGFDGSRLVFGCGAALSRGRKDDLLDAAFDAGINVFDVGTRRYYKDAEVNLAPFLKRRRDDVFLISKAMTYIDVEPNEEITTSQAREGAATWSGLLDQSLKELEVDKVDAYYVMASNNPFVIKSEEIHEAFLAAKRAGKVDHFGLSTHQNAQRVLEAAMQTGWYDLAQIAVTPAGWYDWADKNILANSPPMSELRPFLDRVRASGIGLIGMKAGRYLAGRKFLGWGKPTAFDEYYDEKVMVSDLSAFQRSYSYVLANGLDAVNADMQSFAHLEENLIAAAGSSRLHATA
jgi:aryl-alcohol dehydrogenase-like predicted oxidoreductase